LDQQKCKNISTSKISKKDITIGHLYYFCIFGKENLFYRSVDFYLISKPPPKKVEEKKIVQVQELNYGIQKDFDFNNLETDVDKITNNLENFQLNDTFQFSSFLDFEKDIDSMTTDFETLMNIDEKNDSN
jgi:hypothetical protein